MRFVPIFFGFALLFGWAGESYRAAGSRLMAGVFIYAALAEVFTGLLYWGNSSWEVNPGPMFKTREGKLRLAGHLLIWPYFGFEYALWRLYCWRGAEPHFEEVRPGLFISARIGENEVPALAAAGINAVLDLVAEFPCPKGLYQNPAVSYRSLPVLDGNTLTQEELASAAAYVTGALAEGRKVLVHCTFGHGRSAAVVAAVLLELGEARDPGHARRLLYKLQRRILLSDEQKRVLVNFFIDLVSRENQAQGPGAMIIKE